MGLCFLPMGLGLGPAMSGSSPHTGVTTPILPVWTPGTTIGRYWCWLECLLCTSSPCAQPALCGHATVCFCSEGPPLLGWDLLFPVCQLPRVGAPVFWPVSPSFRNVAVESAYSVLASERCGGAFGALCSCRVLVLLARHLLQVSGDRPFEVPVYLETLLLFTGTFLRWLLSGEAGQLLVT